MSITNRNPSWSSCVTHHIQQWPYWYAKSTREWSEFAVAQTIFDRQQVDDLHWHSFDAYTYVLAYRELNSFDIHGNEIYSAYVIKESPYDAYRFVGTSYWRMFNQRNPKDNRYAFDQGNLTELSPEMQWVQYSSKLEPTPTINQINDPGDLNVHRMMTIPVDRIDPVWKLAALRHYSKCLSIIDDSTHPLYAKYIKLSSRLMD